MDIKSTHLRANIYKLLDRVLSTGEPVEIVRKGRRLRIVPVSPRGKLARLQAHLHYIKDDPDDLVHCDWTAEWKP